MASTHRRRNSRGGTGECLVQWPRRSIGSGGSLAGRQAPGISSVWHRNNAPEEGRLVPLHAGPKVQPQFLDPDPRIGSGLLFTPDGKAVVYTIYEPGTMNLWLQPLDGSPGRQITNFTTDAIQAAQFSPDGKTLGVMLTHFESDVVLLHDEGPSPQ